MQKITCIPKIHLAVFFFLLLGVLLAMVPDMSRAQTTEYSVRVENLNIEENGIWYGNDLADQMGCASVEMVGQMKISGVIVNCIKGAVLVAVSRFFIPIRDFYNRYLALPVLSLALCVLALEMMFNADMTRSIFFVPKVMGFIMKFGLVLYFTQVIGESNIFANISWPHVIMGSVEDLANLVTTPITSTAAAAVPAAIACPSDAMLPIVVETAPGVYVTADVASNNHIVWNRMDCMFGRVLGIGAGLTLKLGIIGYLVAALFTGTYGIAVFTAGFTAIVMFLMAIIRAIYIVVSSYILIGFLIVLGPFFITMILFKSTFRMFESWLDLLIGAVLQPILMFAFLAFFIIVLQVAIFGTDIDGNTGDSIPSIAGALKTDFKTKWEFINTYKNDRPLFSWRIPADPSFYENAGLSKTAAQVIATAASALNPLLDKTVDMNFIYLPFIDWGVDTKKQFWDLIAACVALIVLLDLCLAFMAKVPEIANVMMSARSSVQPVMGYFPGETAMLGALGGMHEGLASTVGTTKGMMGGGGFMAPLRTGANVVTRGIPAAVTGSLRGGISGAMRGRGNAK